MSWLFVFGAGADPSWGPRGPGAGGMSEACLWHPPEVTGHGILDSREAGNSYPSQEECLQQSGNGHVEGVQLRQLSRPTESPRQSGFLTPAQGYTLPAQTAVFTRLGPGAPHLNSKSSRTGQNRVREFASLNSNHLPLVYNASLHSVCLLSSCLSSDVQARTASPSANCGSDAMMLSQE